jgi:hypothetical protein
MHLHAYNAADTVVAPRRFLLAGKQVLLAQWGKQWHRSLLAAPSSCTAAQAAVQAPSAALHLRHQRLSAAGPARLLQPDGSSMQQRQQQLPLPLPHGLRAAGHAAHRAGHAGPHACHGAQDAAAPACAEQCSGAAGNSRSTSQRQAPAAECCHLCTSGCSSGGGTARPHRSGQPQPDSGAAACCY